MADRTSAVAADRVSGIRSRLKTVAASREFVLGIVLIVMAIGMGIASPVFLDFGNLQAILLSLSVEATIAVGMMLLLISGGLDLSVGSILGFTGVVTGLALQAGLPPFPAILLGLLAALSVGLINGLLVAKMNINPFITTLGMSITIRGLLLVIASGRAVLNIPSSFTVIGQGSVLGFQYPIFVMLATVIVGDILLRNARFFRQSYYIGGNEKAARLSGINVDFVKITNYCIVALLAGVAGLLTTARFGTSSVTIGTGVELRVITATIIGGASLSGGEGSVFGAFLGALFMGMVANALNLLGVDAYWQNLVTGLILIIAVLLDVINERRKSRQ
jgi:ribose transport system permease protein